MKNEDLYELFGVEFGNSGEAIVESRVSAQRLLGARASSLYELDFTSTDNETFRDHDERPVTPLDITQLGNKAIQHEIIVSGYVSEDGQVENNFSDRIVQRLDEALNLLSEQDNRILFSIHDLLRLTQHMGKLNNTDFHQFKRYCKQHSAIEYIGDGMFGMADRLNPDTYWPGLAEIEPLVDIAALVNDTVMIMSKTEMSKRTFQHKNILGIVKSQGVELYTNELHEFLTLLSEHPDVTPLENGSFYVAKIVEEDENNTREVEKPITPLKRYNVRKSSDISKALNHINRTPEMRRAKDLAKNVADTRSHKSKKKRSGKKIQGRTHGKKQTFEQLLNTSIKHAPQQKE